MRYILLFILPVLFSLSSCGVDPDIVNQPTATKLDSLQGDWRIYTSVLRPVAPSYGVPITIHNISDTLHLHPDLTGTTGLVPVIPVYNFTYQLLPDDSTLIMNTNPTGTPSYDTNIIHLNGDTLNITTLRKYVNFLPSFSGTFNIYWQMRK